MSNDKFNLIIPKVQTFSNNKQITTISKFTNSINPNNNLVEHLDYNNIKCSNNLLSSNQIIDRWKYDRYKIAKSLNNNTFFNKLDNIISKDNSCKCQLGVLSKSYTSPFACVSCSTLSNLFYNGEIEEDKEFTIKVGNHIGCVFKLHSYKKGIDVGYGIDNYIKTELPKFLGNNILKTLTNMGACESSFQNHIENTNFWMSNGSQIDQYILISSFIENEFNKIGLKCFGTFKWVSECNGDINIIDEVLSLGKGTLKYINNEPKYHKQVNNSTIVSKITPQSTSKFIPQSTSKFTPQLTSKFTPQSTSKFTPQSTSKFIPQSTSNPIIDNKDIILNKDICKGILVQLIVTIHFLNSYSFTHGSPCLNNLGFTNIKNNFTYDGINIKSPITLRIIPSGFSSLTTIGLENQLIRPFYPGTLLTQSVKYDFLPKIEIKPFVGKKSSSSNCSINSSSSNNFNPCLEEYNNMKYMCYKIGDNYNSLISYIRTGVPLFQSSFDLYCFMTSLMCENSFYKGVIDDDELLNIWKSMFNKDDYYDLMEELDIIRDEGISPSFIKIAAILSNYYLRCDAINYALDLIKKLFV
jgi:hypothetical protein